MKYGIEAALNEDGEVFYGEIHVLLENHAYILLCSKHARGGLTLH